MPCMMNGKPVPGIKGQCPIGSTWAEDGQSTPESNNNQLFRDSKIFGNWFDPENYEKFKYKPGTVAKSMDDFFHKMNYTPPGWNPVSTRPKEKSNFISSNEQRRQTFDAGINPRTGKKLSDASAKKSGMEGLMENMKNPEWWSESISGLPSDTRLMRLGQLMNYYGKTPKGRDASDDPSKLWAANEAAAQKNKAAVLAAGAKRADEIYGKKTIEDLTVDVLPDVKEMFGDTFWGSVSSNPNASDEAAMMSLASQVATNIKAITVAYPDKTPGEVRKLALEQVMKDRKLEDLR
jgi:hypothetical protein